MVLHALADIVDLVVDGCQGGVAGCNIGVVLPVDDLDSVQALEEADYCLLVLFPLLIDCRKVHVVHDGLGVALAEREIAQEHALEEVVESFLRVSLAEVEEAQVSYGFDCFDVVLAVH